MLQDSTIGALFYCDARVRPGSGRSRPKFQLGPKVKFLILNLEPGFLEQFPNHGFHGPPHEMRYTERHES
jgi:hypothetical protein